MQSERGRQRRGRTPCSTSIFFANRIDGAGVEAAKSSQLGRPGAHRATKSSQRGRQGQPDRVQSDPKAHQERPKSAQEHPKDAPERPKNAQERSKDVPRLPKSVPRAPNRGSQGAQGRAGHPHRSNQGDLAETLPLRSEINENTAQAQQNRRPGAPRAARSSQPERPGATQTAKSSQPGRPEQPDRASRSQIEPASTRQVARLVAQLTARVPRSTAGRAISLWIIILKREGVRGREGQMFCRARRPADFF